MTCDIGIGRISHDLVFNASNDLLAINNQERVAQDLKIALLMFLGEYPFDTTVGVDYSGSILVKNPDRVLIESILRAVASDVRDVLQVLYLNLKIDRKERKLGVSIQVLTTYGPVEFEAYLNDIRNNT
ncbi:hypothetical protein G3V96_26045 [Escherichia coli]|nr:hypothetical protein [Escherichia coli]